MKLKAKFCEFGNLHDDLVKDRIVCGIENKDIWELLLQDPELMLKTAIDKWWAIEISQIQESDPRIRFKNQIQESDPKKHKWELLILAAT